MVTFQTNKVDVTKEQIKSESGECDDFKALIKILIPNFPTHDDLNVPEEIATEVIKLLWSSLFIIVLKCDQNSFTNA